MKVLVAIPTYNEKENISRMLNSVLSINETIKTATNSNTLPLDVNVLIIDDNSPDGTAKIVKEYISSRKRLSANAEVNPNININESVDKNTNLIPSNAVNNEERVFIIEREKKLGLGTAYVAAFNFALDNGYDYVVTIDCDFSHNPEEIAGFISLAQSEKCGMIVGSRYFGGVRVINWSMKRLLISYFANIYAKFITGVKITDLTGGFNMYDVNCLKKINLDGISSRGYAFQIEMKYRMIKEGKCSFKEYPIIFYERTYGKSKMSKGIIFEAFFKVIKLRLGLFK
ncbi:MAG: polyprenol monophosphomannose synthase [Candidatus Acidulodesulfobacterium acidiphilum]|uniref:Polyprenol monophosphomannose synthase n=1 Tax=Candidatus Acidulodesulfobacterium acidiphilum TaxID=2597224 RepID=A0A520XB73_9DELT|nr:MAG: polyprenol monophosphomannose synthase [Candidatus Acidulodesulfobacterium acidiphilum]